MLYDPLRAGRKARARKRYAPEGFPYPVWSDDDVARARADRQARTSKNGRLTLIDRRKPWQKQLLNFTVTRDLIVRERRW